MHIRLLPPSRLAHFLISLCCFAAAFHAPAARAETAERVVIPSRTSDAPALTATLVKPRETGPRPAIVALHGCGGLATKNGGLPAREEDWAQRLSAAGYIVIFPDSFGSRGLGPQCTVRGREITPRMRGEDAARALEWLAAQSSVDKTRLAVLGWSHGGSSTLWYASRQPANGGAAARVAIAFYPGCRVPMESKDWQARLPLTILMGGADDWTPPEPCRDLGQRPNVHYVEYAGAYHGFDAPDSPVRVRSGLTFTRDGSGRAHVGTDPAARAAAIEEVLRTLGEAMR